MMMKRFALLVPGVLLLLAGLFACTNGGPTQTQEGKRLGHWVVDQWIVPRPDRPVSLLIREKDGQRRVLLRDGDQEERLLGAMTQGLGRNAPLETFFVQVEDTRFIIFRPTPEIVGEARSVHVHALDPNYADPAKSRIGKILRFAKMGMGVMPIFPSETGAWSHLTGVILHPHDSDAVPLADIVFNPPLPIETRFKQVALP